MANITIGSITIAIVWFLVIVVLMQPAITLVTPVNFSQQYYGTSSSNGVVNSTLYNFKNKIQIPLLQQANSSAGFGASAFLQSFSGLAFVYGAFNLFFSTLTNLPSMIYLIFTGSASYTSLIPFALTSIASIALLTYVVISLVYKGISAWMKTDVENIGG